MSQKEILFLAHDYVIRLVPTWVLNDCAVRVLDLVKRNREHKVTRFVKAFTLVAWLLGCCILVRIGSCRVSVANYK